MPEWIPTRATAKGRLVLAALELFGSRGFRDVSVVELAHVAGVTTGALYHHFGSKAGLYDVVRADVERRVLDRINGAFSARPEDRPTDAGLAALVVAFDYVARAGFSHLLAEAHPEGRHEDAVATLLGSLVDRDGVPLGRVLVAAWREALLAVAEGATPADARAALLGVRAP